ncbi:hypothetical protein PC110_g21390, partial [Phytophthora cactorum]
TLPLSKADKEARKAWVWKMLMNPEGKDHYWRDLSRPPRENRSGQAGGGSCMVWAALSAKGKTKIAFVYDRQNSEHYIFTVSEFLLPFVHLHYGTEFIYQQDGASIHTSKTSMEFWKSKE